MMLLGAVLAGGESRRFGSDKLSARLGERTLLDHAIHWLSGHVDTVVVCGRAGAPVRCLADIPAPGLGPLGGLAAALCHAEAGGYAAVLSIPGDTPRLPADLVARLQAAGPVAFVASCPVIGLWPAALAAKLVAHLTHNPDRSMRAWCRAAGAIPLELDQPIPNVNHPTDLDALDPSRSRM